MSEKSGFRKLDGGSEVLDVDKELLCVFYKLEDGVVQYQFRENRKANYRFRVKNDAEFIIHSLKGREVLEVVAKHLHLPHHCITDLLQGGDFTADLVAQILDYFLIKIFLLDVLNPLFNDIKVADTLNLVFKFGLEVFVPLRV